MREGRTAHRAASSGHRARAAAATASVVRRRRLLCVGHRGTVSASGEVGKWRFVLGQGPVETYKVLVVTVTLGAVWDKDPFL